MPATNLKKISAPVKISPVDRRKDQVNGLYVHSNPPKVLQVNSSLIRHWLRSGDLARLEEVILQGKGHELLGENSPDFKVRNFLKHVPRYMSRIKELHQAAVKGDKVTLEKIMESSNPNGFERNIFLSRNQTGVGLLHKAVYYGHTDVVQFLVSNFPQCVNSKDGDGKTPLHYCGASGEASKIWSMLVQAGADPRIVDSKGKPPSYYMQKFNEIVLPPDETFAEVPTNAASVKSSLIIKPSNIRIWIHDKDLGKLLKVLWEGHGLKLRCETSNNPKIKRFLDGVPFTLNAIKDTHAAAINGDLQEFVRCTSYPVPLEILTSKDANGLNPLHKAAGLGHLDIVKNILERNEKLIRATDHEGRTPLHYGAALKDDGSMYNLLTSYNANESALDNHGRPPLYYKTKSKEITKYLTVLPEAPRMNIMFPPSWDWMLLHSNSSTPVTLAPITNSNFLKSEIQSNLNEILENDKNYKERISEDEEIEEWKHSKAENLKLTAGEESDPEEIKPIKFNELTAVEPSKNSDLFDAPAEHEEKAINHEIESPDANPRIASSENDKSVKAEENYDIWTNNNDEGTAESGDALDYEDFYDDKFEADFEQNEDELSKESQEESSFFVKEEAEPEVESGEGNPNNGEAEDEKIKTGEEKPANEGKTEWEIGEERQRLLDEGLVRIPDEEDDDGPGNGAGDDLNNEGGPNGNTVNENDVINQIIEDGDLEALASLVLDGEGCKLLGKSSTNSEVQTFLENLPSYLDKIAAVHRAVRRGSLKDLQTTLDRRRFAVAKEYSDNLGATPLHIAVLYQKPQIIKYLGGRFPETLNFKDKLGRTPLHYAAVMPDDNRIFHLLLNLGADRKVKDDAGFTPANYQENPGALTFEKLLKEFDAPSRVAQDILCNRENILFSIEDGKYLAEALGNPLVRGLTEVSSKRPKNPTAHLANFLYDSLKENRESNSPSSDAGRGLVLEPEVVLNKVAELNERLETNEVDEEVRNESGDGSQSNYAITERDEFGQSVLHFAAARAHGRSGLFQLIEEINVNLGFRDELYRTARDIAIQAEIKQNVDEIDNYVISLAARGELEKLVELFLEGYDHITDLRDVDDDLDIVTIALKKNQEKTAAFLKAIPIIEVNRERMYEAIRSSNLKLVQDILENSRENRFMVIGKNGYGRCSLHIAVLCQQKEITEYLVKRFPESLKIGDNLERTPLHYAMGVDEVDTLSKILIKSGAKRIAKDLKGRQPTYYFMNKSDILRLQEEETS